MKGVTRSPLVGWPGGRSDRVALEQRPVGSALCLLVKEEHQARGDGVCQGLGVGHAWLLRGAAWGLGAQAQSSGWEMWLSGGPG